MQVEDLASQVASSQAAETQWRNCCYRFAAQLEERFGQEEGLVCLNKQLASLKTEYYSGKQELRMFQAKTQATCDEISSLLKKVKLYVQCIVWS